jgi:hypothetical protein
MPFKIRRGTNTQRLNFIPSEGELLYTTDTKNLYIGDGITIGGNLASGGNGGGLIGPMGPQGDPGPEGPHGYNGSRGYTGSKGPKGDQGYPGQIGPMGAIGPCGPDGYTGSAGPIGPPGETGIVFLGVTDNVLYVSKNGNDANDGTTFDRAKLTIKAALAICTRGTTIYVRSGDYTERNPLNVPEKVSIVGDNLRTTTVRPYYKNQDLFYVNNGCYISNMTFKDHVAPAAAVAFNPNPDDSAGVIFISPYIQNCTSMTTTGKGIFINGDVVGGTKSMVMDAFTQFNQGGIGVHIVNRGYAQLVSIFTICCDVGVLCESGGYCSITNSNNSFGNYALKADGLSEALYSGKFQDYGYVGSNAIFVNGLTTQPNVNDAMVITSNNIEYIYTVAESTEFTSASTDIVEPDYSSQSANARNARNAVLDELAVIQVNTVEYINSTYPDFDYDRAKCTRDIGLIVNAVVDDMVFGTNFRTVVAGRRYYSAVSSEVVGRQLTETVAAVRFIKAAAIGLIQTGNEASIVGSNFDILIDIMQNTLSHEPALIFNNPVNVNPNRSKASAIIQANKSFFIEEAVSYIAENTNPLFGYDRDLCKRDIASIIDAIVYDLVLENNYRSILAARAYFRSGAAVVTSQQRAATVASFTYLKGLIHDLVSNNTVARTALDNLMDIIINVLANGLEALPNFAGNNPPGFTSTPMYNSKQLIVSNTGFIKAEVIKYITNNYPSLTFDHDIYMRDIGYILDTVSYDMTYGGNITTTISGNAFYSFSTLQIGANEKAPIMAAYGFMKTLIGNIAQSNAITPLQGIVAQVTGTPGNVASADFAKELIQNIINIINNQTQPIVILPSISWSNSGFLTVFTTVKNKTAEFQASVTDFIEVNYSYKQETCKRDVGYIVDAISYDVLYGGNLQTAVAADAYYSGGILQVPGSQKQLSIDTFNYIGTICAQCVVNTVVSALNSKVAQDRSLPAATSTEANIVTNRFGILTNLIDNAYTSLVTFVETVPNLAINGTTPFTLTSGQEITFHQFSLITASGQSFEWVGTGTNVNTALPALGAKPIAENQVVELNGGRVYYTGSDQTGNFFIGDDLLINRAAGTIEGRAFNKSLFAVMTPFILAIGG